ncbi:MAG: hypothetical protein ACI8RD_000457 [Bacillariaceae sp.]|jgi:hypothetical protein
MPVDMDSSILSCLVKQYFHFNSRKIKQQHRATLLNHFVWYVMLLMVALFLGSDCPKQISTSAGCVGLLIQMREWGKIV